MPCQNLVCCRSSVECGGDASVSFVSECGVCPESHTLAWSTRAPLWQSFTPTVVADSDGSGELEVEEMEELCMELVIAAHQQEMGTLRKMESNGQNVDRLKKSINKMFDPKLEALKDPIRKTEFLGKVSLLCCPPTPPPRLKHCPVIPVAREAICLLNHH